MASRENQGLHIALILLVMLTVGLCVVSFVFYSKAERLRGEAEDAKNRMAQAQADYDQAAFKAQTLTYMITGQGKSWDEIAEDLENIPGSDSEELTQIRQEYKDNMLLFGATDREAELARNYENLPTYLLSTIRDLNQQLADLRETETQLTQEKASMEQAANKRVQEAAEARDKARNDLASRTEQFTQDLSEVRKKWEETQNEKVELDSRIVELNTQLEEQQADLTKRIENLTNIVDDQRNELRNLETTSFESPDAVITTANQKQGVVYIDVGAEDNLRVQQTFSVFDKGTTGVMDAEPKGRIEVRQILGAHVAMCRILEDEISNIITPGDLVFTPAWSPGKQIHFAMCGFIDLTEDGQNDAELLVKLIELNGGVIDDDVTVQTRYLIEGKQSGGGTTNMDVATDLQEDYNEKVRAAIEIGVDRLSPQKLLTLMGWEADVSTVILGSGETPAIREEAEGEADEEAEESPFRKRTPPRGGDGAF